MVFSHLIFIYAFLPLLMLLYFARKEAGWRRGVLLLFSLVFYAWGEPIYILLMLGSALLNFLFGRPLMYTVIMFGIDARANADGSITLVQTTKATLKR